MLTIDYSPQAQRTLGTLPSTTRRLISQMVNAVAELAELFPNEPKVWSRLGRVTDRRVEIDVERRGVCVELADRAVRVLRIIDTRTGARRTRAVTSPRSSRKSRPRASL